MHATDTEDALHRLARAVDAAYNDGDSSAMAECWAEDGLNVNPFGDRFVGRAEIEADLRSTLSGFMKGTRHELAITEISSIDDRTAAADGIATITGIAGDPSQALSAAFSMICTRVSDERWQVAQMRAYRFVPRPA